MKKAYFVILIVASLVTLFQALTYSPLPEGKSVDLSQGVLAYNEYNSDNEAILIMIHGSPGSKEDFKNLAPQMENYRVYTLDMYGFGESEKSVANYGATSQAEAVLEFMDKLTIDNASILGYSWGAFVAEEFAFEYPKKTNLLILLAGAGIQEGEPTGSHILEKARAVLSYPVVAYYPGSLAGGIGWRHGFLMSFIQTDQRPIREKMKNINVETLIIHGAKDTVVPVWVAEEHKNLIPNSNLIFYNGGHGQVFSDTSEIAEIINNYEK